MNFRVFGLIIAFVVLLMNYGNAVAQIGYQVALLDTATGEPRANETVSITIEITDSDSNIIYSGVQTATTNDFGILSLMIGNESTFDNADWTKLPLYVSAKVDGVLIGKTQILSVPVAEYAKRSPVHLTPEILCGKLWYYSITGRNGYYKFNTSKTGTCYGKYSDGQSSTDNFTWRTINDLVIVNFEDLTDSITIFLYDKKENVLLPITAGSVVLY